MPRDAEPDGFNILNSCGPAAWQTIFHFHLHVVPRYEDDPLKLPWMPRGGDARRDRAPPRDDRIREARADEPTPDPARARRRRRRDGRSHDPPLNLFSDNAFNALMDCLDEVEGSDARALVWRAEGDIFTGGVDVNGFQRIVDAGGDRRS